MTSLREIVKQISAGQVSINNHYMLVKCKSSSWLSNILEVAQINFAGIKNMYSALLYQEDRCIRKSVSIWLEELCLHADTLLQEKADANEVANLAKIYNVSALLFALTGRTKQAEDLCKKQIDLFFCLAKRNFNQIKYILQPWINLGRIDREKRDFSAALNKFNLLHFASSPKIIFGEWPVAKYMLLSAIEKDNEIQRMVTINACLEPIKTLLLAQDYKQTIVYSNQYFRLNQTQTWIAYEAQIIAFAMLGKVGRAIELGQAALQEVVPNLLPVFALREAELLATVESSHAKIAFERLASLLHYQRVKSVDVQQLYFGVVVAKQMQRFGYQELFITCMNALLKDAERLEDELLQVECLESLVCHLRDKRLEHRLCAIVSRTSYMSLLKKYPSSYINYDYQLQDYINRRLEMLFYQLMNVKEIT